ncbi:MAG TPA: amino acid permease [Steroidobacteraceae bacterium]|jgi:L-asparagine transporter-like permease|nr:amino acid permease [Steroidobacteraceae bacterium]
MISIGGIIGAGVFVGSSTAISTIGPAVVLSYIFAGIVVFMVIKILARMALDQPGLGAFTEYVRVALGPSAGFISGWMYWYFWVIVVGIEAIAGAKIVHGWLPMFEVWQIGLGLMAVLTLVNLTSARSYGEFEFWFASIKVAAIIVFIVVLASWLLGVGGHESPGFSNLTSQGGFAPHGYPTVFTGVTTVIFSMCGAEIITVAAAESAESGKTMSRLAASVVVRILLFYVLAIFLIVCVLPWNAFKSGDSTFSMVLQHIGIPGAKTIMDCIVLTAVLSCLNSGVYVTARTMFAMADKGDAPRWLTAVNSRQVPARAILLGSAFGFISMFLNVGSDNEHIANLFTKLINASGAIMLIVYCFVALAHYRFPYTPEAEKNSGPKKTADIVAGVAALAILVVMSSMAFIPGMKEQLYPSLGLLAAILIALAIKRLVQRAA